MYKYIRILRHISAYFGILWHTLAYFGILRRFGRWVTQRKKDGGFTEDTNREKVFDLCVKSSYRFLNNNVPVTASPTTWRFTHVGDGGFTTDLKRFFKILYHGILSFMGRVTDSLSEFHSIQKYYDDIAEMWDGK